METININTTELSEKMVDAGIPPFGGGYNTTQGPFHYVGNSGNIYHNKLPGQIAAGQRNISNQIAGFSGIGNEPMFFANAPAQQFVGSSPLGGGVAANGGGPGWEAYAGTTGAIAGEMYYSDKFGTWMGKNFKMYQQQWGGNGFTGGKLKFGKRVNTGFKVAGYGLGVWNVYSINSQHKSGQLSDGQMYLEQGSNAITTVFGLYGAAWGVGWELGRAVTNTGWYQEAKFNFWYNRWEGQVGAPSQSNEVLWNYFFQNYKP